MKRRGGQRFSSGGERSGRGCSQGSYSSSILRGRVPRRLVPSRQQRRRRAVPVGARVQGKKRLAGAGRRLFGPSPARVLVGAKLLLRRGVPVLSARVLDR